MKENDENLKGLLQWLINNTLHEKVIAFAITFSYKEYCIGVQLERPLEHHAYWIHYHFPYKDEFISEKIVQTLMLFKNKMI